MSGVPGVESVLNVQQHPEKYRVSDGGDKTLLTAPRGLSQWLGVKNPPVMQEMRVRFLGWEDPLEKEMATHSSTLD